MKDTSNDVKLINESELQDRFELKKYFAPLIPEGVNFIVCEGDVNLKGSFSLDGDIGEWEDSDDCKQWCDQLGFDTALTNVAGIIVNGNLNIDGSLFNFDDECGVLLLVTGGLTAKNVRAGGAVMYILGNSHVEECVYSYYNGGALKFLGDLTTTVYVNIEHATSVKGRINAPFRACSMGYAKNSAGFRVDSDGDLVIPKELEEKLSYKAMEDGIEAALYLEGTVLRKEGDKPPNLDEQNWLDKISANYKLISKLPAEFRTEEFFCKLADTVSDKWDIKELGRFPKDMLTDKVCEHIVTACEQVYKQECEKNDIPPYCVLEHIPERFRTPELLAMFLEKPFAGKTYNYVYFAYIPDASLEHYLNAVKGKIMDKSPIGGYYYLHVVDYEVDHAKVDAWHGNYDAALARIEKAKALAREIVTISPRKDMGELADYGDYRPVYYEGYIRYLQGDKNEAKRLLELSKRLCTLFYRDPADYGNKAELIAYKNRINPVEK